MAFLSFGPYEIIVVLVVAVLLFGRRLPEVGRSLGKGIVEFKRGIRDMEDDIDQAGQSRKLENRETEKVEQPASNLPEDQPAQGESAKSDTATAGPSGTETADQKDKSAE